MLRASKKNSILAWFIGSVALFSPAFVASDASSEARPDIEVLFTGLMLFTLDNGRMTVELHTDAEHHDVMIQIVDGPSSAMRYPLLFARNPDKRRVITLEVNDGPSAEWHEPPRRAFSIKTLHPSMQGQPDLEKKDREFRPPFIMNAGVFEGVDSQWTRFDKGNGGQVTYYTWTAVMAKITLNHGQWAVLKYQNGVEPPIYFGKVTGQEPAYKVHVTNLPDWNHVCEHTHFRHYYDGFRFRRGAQTSNVPDDERYEARGIGVPDPCSHTPNSGHMSSVLAQTESKQATYSRPCIPIVFE